MRRILFPYVVSVLALVGTQPCSAQLASAQALSATHILEERYADLIETLRPHMGQRGIDVSNSLANAPANGLNLVQAQKLFEAGAATAKGVRPGESEFFWSMNVAANQAFQLRAQLRKIGKHCYIYVEDGQEMTDAVAEKLAAQFDDQIYPTDRKWFGSERSPGIDGDPRITLLFLDIQDGWEPGRGYVAGYYFPLDGVSQRLFPQSNEREMVYLDVYPGNPARNDYLGILAHEFQHMIHNNQDSRETKWLNEAFAQVAFFACGYGHAPQSFMYLNNTDVNLTNFQNSLENYGAAYLYTYYLLTHYAGATLDEQQQFFRQITASPKQGMESVAAVLQAHGEPKNIESIFIDWAVANTAQDSSINGGVYGYDESLQFGVNTPQTYSLLSPPSGTVEEEVNAWASDYIALYKDVHWTPANPTMINKVTIQSEQAGVVKWNINDHQLPPSSLIPEGSEVVGEENIVVTPLTTLEDGSFGAMIGPFARLGVAVRHINYSVVNEDGSAGSTSRIPVFTIDSLTEPNTALGFANLNALRVPLLDAAPLSNDWTFSFEGARKGWFGKNKRFAVRAVVKRGTGTEVLNVALDEKNMGSVAIPASDDMDSLTFLVIGLEGKKLTYKYTITPPSASPAHIQAMMAASVGQIRDLGRQDRFQGLSTKFGLSAPAMTAHGVNPFNEDEDNARDNLQYVFNKNQELFHALTHLQIDPQLLEGQIMKMWKLLEIVRGFPHLPLPEGWAFVDYDVSQAQSLVAGWAQHFGIEVEGLIAEPGPVPEDLDATQVKEVSKRLWLATSIIEHGYNNGLILGQDFSVTAVYFVRFIFGVKNTVDIIADGLSGIPIVGRIADKAKKLIISKLLKVANNFSWAIASRLGSPWSTVMPIAVQFITNIVGRKLEVPSDQAEFMGYTKEMVVGLAGKYLLTSIPRYGYTARGQQACDLAQQYASSLTLNSEYAAAYAKVWDDGQMYEHESVREKIDIQVTKRHSTAMRNQQIAWITGKLGQVARIGAILDPTSITKIVAIALEVATAGLFVHSGYTTASYFFQLPRGDVLRGVNLAFDPNAVESEAARANELVMVAGPGTAEIQALNLKIEDAFSTYLNAIQEDMNSAVESVESFDQVVEADENLDAVIEEAEAMIYGTTLPDDESAKAQAAGDALEAFYAESQTCALNRAALIADLMVRRMNGGSVNLSSKYRPVFESYMARLATSLDVVAKAKETTPVIYVQDAEVTHNNDGSMVLTISVKNLSWSRVENVEVELSSGVNFTTDEATRKVFDLGRRGERTLAWKLDVAAGELHSMATITVLTGAEGVRGLSHMVCLTK